MSRPNHPLILAEDSVLVAIDVQSLFLGKLKTEQSQPLLDRITWVTQVAIRLGIPTIATAEDIDVLGTVHPEYLSVLPADTSVHTKMTFGLASEAEIMSEIGATKRRTTVLIGLETDVCVSHSAIGLLAHGYRVVVIEDATGSPGSGHEAGLRRIAGAGGLVVTLKGIYYEWLRTVNASNAFREKNGELMPPPRGISL